MANFFLLVALCAIASGQSAYDPSVVLARTRDKVLELADRLPKCTCMQTVNRAYFRPLVKPRPGTPCDQFEGESRRGRRRLDLEATDRLHLDVIVTGGEEIYSWAGASRFESRWVGEFIGAGPISTGGFGTFLLDILRNDGTTFEFEGATKLGGKDLLHYAYQVLLAASHYFTLKTDRQWLTTAFRGSMWVNPANDELERLTVLTSELPPETGACTADTRVDYQSVHLGNGGFLLPLENELHFLLRDGTESTSVSTYSKCREYLAESGVSFEEPAVAAKAPVGVAAEPVRVPDGLALVLALTTLIDTDIAGAGDAIAARVKNAVRAPGSGAVLIPAGAVALGRIVRMEHRLVPAPHFMVSISWAEIEDHGAKAPFFARTDEAVDLKVVRERAQNLGIRVPVWLPPPGESKRAGGWFIFPTSKKRYVVPAGYESRWRTVAPEAR